MWFLNEISLWFILNQAKLEPTALFLTNKIMNSLLSWLYKKAGSNTSLRLKRDPHPNFIKCWGVERTNRTPHLETCVARLGHKSCRKKEEIRYHFIKRMERISRKTCKGN